MRVRDDGRVAVEIRGLVIPGRGNPVAVVTASVVCNAAAVTMGAETREFPMDTAGDARTRDRVDLPEPCLAPAVLVHPRGDESVHIAALGR